MAKLGTGIEHSNSVKNDSEDKQSQFSLISKLTNLFRKNTNEATKLEVTTDYQKDEMTPINRQFSILDTSNKYTHNLDSYPELFSPIQEEKTPHKDSFEHQDEFESRGLNRVMRSS
jgi:hypothetical protein